MILLMLTTALAQDPAAVDWKDQAAEEVEKPQTSLSLEFGGSLIAGNSQSFSAYGAADFAHKWDSNKFGAKFNGTTARSRSDTNGDGVLDSTDDGYKRTAERYGGQLRYDRFLSKKDSLYALGGGFTDEFAGFDWRVHEQVGYSRKLVDLTRTEGEGDGAKTMKTELVGEIGIDFAQEDYVTGVDPNDDQYLAGRAFIGFKHQFTPGTSFTNDLEAYENLFTPEDFRLINQATLSAKLSDKISFKLSHQLLFYNKPVNGFKSTDQTVLATLVASIL